MSMCANPRSTRSASTKHRSPVFSASCCAGWSRERARRGRLSVLSAATGAEERVSAAHRAKLAYVYVRQSSVNQVRQHQTQIARLLGELLRRMEPREGSTRESFGVERRDRR